MFWNEFNKFSVIFLLTVLVIGMASVSAMEEETEKRIKLLEVEFVHLIEHPFEKSHEEAVKQLKLLLAQGVNPHVPRKSCYEMCAFEPITYLMYQLSRATEVQKSRLVDMIFMMCHPPMDDHEVS